MLLTLLLTACPGKDLDEGAHCEDTPSTLAVDEVSPIGFAAADVLVFADGTHETSFDWAHHDPSALTLDLAADPETTRFVYSEAVYPDDGAEHTLMAVECPDRVEVDAVMGFTTADGRFAETWALTLIATEATAVGFDHEIDLDTVTGTWDILEDVTAEGYDELSAWARGTFDAAGTRGGVDGQASGGDPCEEGDTCSAWSEVVEVGTWGGGDTR